MMSPPRIAPMLAGNVMGSGDDAFVIAEWRDPGGAPGPPRLIAPLHVHHHDDEAWYVLEGTLCVQAGPDRERDTVEIPAGAGTFVRRGTPHTYWNPSSGPARYLLVMTSKIYRLIQEIHSMEERTPDALKAVFRKHDSEIV